MEWFYFFLITNTDVIKKLIGPVEPVGDCAIDALRFENLEELCEVADDLIMEIHAVAECRKRWPHLGSVKKAGDYADKFLERCLEVRE